MVEVWVIDTRPADETSVLASAASRILALDERRRARALAAGPDRESFIAARLALREILSAFESGLAHGEPFNRGPGGKPYLARGPAFSFSATAGLAVVAISEAGDVGIDVEQVRDIPFAQRAFATIPALSGFANRDAERVGGRTLSFLRAWTRFEASLKRDGRTLGPALADLGGPGARVGELSLANAPTVSDVPVRHGYVAACAHTVGETLNCVPFRWGSRERT